MSVVIQLTSAQTQGLVSLMHTLNVTGRSAVIEQHESGTIDIWFGDRGTWRIMQDGYTLEV